MAQVRNFNCFFLSPVHKSLELEVSGQNFLSAMTNNYNDDDDERDDGAGGGDDDDDGSRGPLHDLLH